MKAERERESEKEKDRDIQRRTKDPQDDRK